MTSDLREERARKQADELRQVIYEALRDGYNVSVYLNNPIRSRSGQTFLQDKRTVRLNGAEYE
jgi:hypothetical protein